MSFLFNSDVGNNHATRNGGQTNREDAFASYAPNCGQCRDRITGIDYNNGKEAARAMYSQGVRDPAEITRRLGF